jgi:predicted protein tyrosine phosphatase
MGSFDTAHFPRQVTVVINCSERLRVMKVLFVCSQGRMRSRTAEILSLYGGLEARSCGTDADALVPVNNELLRWCDWIICMEQRHSEQVFAYMGSEGKSLCSLGIPDEFLLFDSDLIGLLIGALRHKVPAASAAIERGAARWEGWQALLRAPA